MNGSGLDRLVPHAMMQANESLYIGDFDLEPLQMSSQIQLPDMEALRLRQRMGSPPSQLHHLMPAPHPGLAPPGLVPPGWPCPRLPPRAGPPGWSPLCLPPGMAIKSNNIT